MYRKLVTVAAATTLMAFGLQAQKTVSCFETINGKERKIETAFLNKTSKEVKPDIKQDRPDDIYKDGKVIRLSENKPPKTLDIKRENLQEKYFKPSVSVKKSERDDVATVTFKVIGCPMCDYGYSDGFHMILDADAEMNDFFYDYFRYEWEVLYEACEYKIPQNASPDLNNPNGLVDNEVSINIPSGIYDFAFIIPALNRNRLYMCRLVENGNEYESLIDDFEFKAGFEYVFKVDYFDQVEFYLEYDAVLTEIILPLATMELTDQEDVTIVIYNGGINSIIGNIELSYRVNEDEWIEPETFNLNLDSWNNATYTFNTKANFSIEGLYKVEAKVEYESDMWVLNNNITGYTRKSFPRSLPFIENFEKPENLLANWTVINADEYPTSFWTYNDWNMDADEGIGCLQVTVPRNGYQSDDYLITDPIIIPESGLYNISFYANPFYFQPLLKILYGNSINIGEMKVLVDYTSFDFEWNIYIKHFEIVTSGNYYFAFHYYSYPDDMGFGAMDFDKVKISAGEFVGEPDIIINRGLGPVSSCDMTNEGIIGAEVYNRGTEPIREFTLTYQVGEGEIISQTFNKIIGLKESIKVYFEKTYDFYTIGDYNIKFTASTPNEVAINNNETEIIIKHYEPITNLPFISDFNNPEDLNDWMPSETDGWGIAWVGYYPNYSMPGVPLLSRCITLEPDIYRFTFSITAGYANLTDDFYVTYGKSGTDPYEWKPIKKFLNYHTGNGTIFVEEYIIFEIIEQGNYSFAIVATRPEGDLVINGAVIEVAPDHDFNFKKVESSSIAFFTPKYQFEGEHTFTASLQNKGKTADENINIKLMINNDEFFLQNFTFTEIGQTLNVELNPVFEEFTEESLLLNFVASNDYDLVYEVNMIKIVSDSTYAWDSIDKDFFDGIGVDGHSFNFGLIYELQKGDIVTSITVGLSETQYTEKLGLAVYAVNGNLELGKLYLEVAYPRTNGNNEKGITFDIPDTYLKPGKYYFELRQLSGNNIGVAYDGEPDGFFYESISNPGKLTLVSGWGYIHIRPNFGKYGVGISSEKISDTQLILYPNPTTSELRIENGELRMERITVYNAVGQVVIAVSNVNATTYRLNTEMLNSGIYFISVQTKNGITNSKFVVNK